VRATFWNHRDRVAGASEERQVRYEIASVPVKSAFKLKINWAGFGGLVAALVVFFGLDISDAQKTELIGAITLIQSIVVMALRTFFSASVAPQSLPASYPPLEE